MTFTKEWLQQTISGIEAIRDEIPFGLDEDERNTLEALKLALAAMTAPEQEPVADVVAWSSPNEERTCDIRWRRHDVKPGPLYTAPPTPVVPKELLSAMEEILLISDRDHDAWHKAKAGIVSCRAAMLQGAEPVTQHDGLPHNPQIAAYEKIMEEAIQDGYALVPMKLTAENGAKGALLGEFSETKFINCPECFGEDDCETCDGSGRIEVKVPVTWTTIKAIWAKGVEHFTAAPQQEA